MEHNFLSYSTAPNSNRLYQVFFKCVYSSILRFLVWEAGGGHRGLPLGIHGGVKGGRK